MQCQLAWIHACIKHQSRMTVRALSLSSDIHKQVRKSNHTPHIYNIDSQCHSRLYLLVNIISMTLSKHKSALRSRVFCLKVSDLSYGKPTRAAELVTCLFGLAEWMFQAPGPISEYVVYSESATAAFTAKISNINWQIVEHEEEKRVYLLLAAASIKQTAKRTG